MYQTIVTIVVFLFWMCHGWILYTIDQFCQHRFCHTPRNEPKSVTRTIQSSQDEGTPRQDQKIDQVSQPERPSASLNSDRPHSCENPENLEIHHSMATDNGIEDYAEMLEEEKVMNHEISKFQHKFQQSSFIVTGLEETQYENDELKREVASLRSNALEQEKHRQIAETQLKNDNAALQRNLKTNQDKYQKNLALITAELQKVTEEKLSQKCTLDMANDTINAKVYLLDTLRAELHNLKVNQQEQSSIQEENDGLREQVASLREIESKLIEDKEILESKLNSLDSENRVIMDAKEAAEQSAKQAEVLVDEQLKNMEWLYSDLELATQIIGERREKIRK
ncbi:Uncharacterized protein APZ42_029483 [Daphnia magna]|uniref:Uncharacterized protein n=1 Tax=Daphnia magna TaxID=35525 RepID=A0A164PKT4_9CRUS|nr:Uncharacterized protein APZ42_029483 [Daphnia magna]